MHQLRRIVFSCLFVALLALVGGCGKKKATTVDSIPTFRADIAPIIFKNCSYCHRPGETAPFELLNYADVSKRSKQIADVVQSRYMPPWLPAKGYNHFKDERTLTDAQIDIITRWVEAGAPEGTVSPEPKPPTFSSEWQKGEPDLIVKMPEPYEIPPAQPDKYQNFVIPIPGDNVRYVRAMEFRPGNARVVHHAFVAIDETKGSLREDEKEPGPGFGGMHMPTSSWVPSGQFFSWQPGRMPMGGSPERAWRLAPHSYLVVQLHLQSTGKKETVQSEIGLYFTEEPGTDITFKLGLSSYDLDIPAGATNFLAQDAFVLPVDVELLAILPHAHYIAREMQGVATLPDGSNQWLIEIPQWDFNWQGEYWYKEPIQLPAGTRVGMRFFYDNSTNNLANPSNPPRPITYGLQSINEMAELWMMFRVKTEQDRLALNRAALPKTAREVIEYNNILLKKEPDNATAWIRKAAAHLSLGQSPEATTELQRALQLDPASDEAHYYLGLIAFQGGDMKTALDQFEAATELNANNFKAYGYQGLVYMRENDLMNAEQAFNAALRANPKDEVAKSNLELIQKSPRPR